MKKFVSVLLTLTLVLALMSATMPAYAEEINTHPRLEKSFVYELICDGTEARITDYYGNDAEVIIPSILGGVPVTEIQSIGALDFITSLTVPASVTHIESGAFSGLDPTTFTVEKGNPVYHSDGNCLIETEAKTLVRAFPHHVIPTDGSVTVIGYFAFAGLDELTEITLPDGVTAIGENAFIGCAALENVTIPDSVTFIDNYAFYGCRAIRDFAFPKGLTYIGDYAFYQTGLTDITLPDTLTHIGSVAFEATPWYGNLPNGTIYLGDWIIGYKGERSQETLVIRDGTVGVAGNAFWDAHIAKLPDSLRYIGPEAFQWCEFDDDTMPKNLVRIDESGFHGCGITDVVLPDTMEEIGDHAFFNNDEMVSLTIPKSVTDIGESPTYGCGSIESLSVEEGNPVYHSDGNCVIETATRTLVFGCQTSVIPDDGSVTSIGVGAFAGYMAKDVNLPASVTSIGDHAYENCGGLTSVTLPDTVTSLGNSVFANCQQLKEVTIPGSVTKIPENAFSYCERLVTITILSGVTDIEKDAFFCCGKLKNVALPDSVAHIGERAFYECKALTRIVLPKNLTRIDGNVFSFCESLTRVVLPKSLTCIEYSSFYYYDSLKTVYYGGTEEDRNNMNILKYNDPLLNATWVYETEKLPILPGDVNDDDSMDMKDVLMVRQFIAASQNAINESAADVNGDQSVDMKDVLTMRKIIAGLASPLT